MIIAALFFLQSLSPEQEARAEALYTDLRCVVCQNQSIADSDAEIAAIMREIVRERIEAGDSDEEVRAFLSQRYGEYVLLTPSRSPKNAILWVGPMLALAVGGALVFSLFRSSAKPEA